MPAGMAGIRLSHDYVMLRQWGKSLFCKRMKQFFLLALLSVTLTRGYTQVASVFNRISTEDAMGLASNQVNCLYQDSRGFIWVGTANGLQRFDGSKFIRFQHRSNSVPIDEVNNIVEDDKGRLWLSFINSREFGVFTPSDYSYRSVPLKVNGEIPVRAEYNLWKDRRGNIFLNISKFMVLRYNEKEDAFTEDTPFKLPKGWKPGVRFFEDTIKDHLYMVSFDSGIAVYDYKTKETYTSWYNPQKIAVISDPRVHRVNSFFIDSRRRNWVFYWPIWAGGPQVKECFDSTGRSLQDTSGLNPSNLGYTEYHDMYETRDGNLWVRGLNVLFSSDENENRFSYYKSDHKHNYLIQYNTVHQVMEDRDGSIWVATDKGLFFTNAGTDRYVSNLWFDESKGNSFISDIMQTRNGDYWFADWGHGVFVLDRKFRRKENFAYKTPVPAHWPLATKLAFNDTWAVHEESKTGLIWIGNNGGILNIHDPVLKTSKWLLDSVFDNRTIRTITEDKNGALWFGTQGGRVIKYEDGRFRVMHQFYAIISKVFIDRQNMVWASVLEKGLYAIDRESGEILQHYHKDDKKTPTFGNAANDIEQLSDSIIVYGAGALNFINKYTGKVSIYSFRDGLPSNTIQRLRMDKQGYLWIMTTSGLCRYNPVNNRITPYGRKDGIIFSDLARACDYVCDEGYVMFGGENAVMFFDPRSLQPEKKVQNVTLTDVKLNNDFLPLDSMLKQVKAHFTYTQNSLSFYFSALSYVMNDKLTYYYMLEGADKDWVRSERNEFVSYSQLPPGQYTFKVYCENSEGIKSSIVTTFPFHITPPFYRTAWFIMLLVAFVGSMIYLIHRLRVNRLIAVQKLRLRVARDLHDDMGSTLSTINILSSMAKSKINTDTPKATEFITKISDNSQRMMEAMDDIVWSIKPSNDSMEKITARMREFATNVLEAKEIEIDFKVAPKVNDIKLNMEARRDFFLIFKEAVNNAAKYSKASLVHVFITVHHKKLLLMVHDNGTGFEVNESNRGNGLGNMQKRADAMNGRLLIKSAPGEGTKITLTVPLT